MRVLFGLDEFLDEGYDMPNLSFSFFLYYENQPSLLGRTVSEFRVTSRTPPHPARVPRRTCIQPRTQSSSNQQRQLSRQHKVNINEVFL